MKILNHGFHNKGILIFKLNTDFEVIQTDGMTKWDKVGGLLCSLGAGNYGCLKDWTFFGPTFSTSYFRQILQCTDENVAYRFFSFLGKSTARTLASLANR